MKKAKTTLYGSALFMETSAAIGASPSPSSGARAFGNHQAAGAKSKSSNQLR